MLYELKTERSEATLRELFISSFSSCIFCSVSILSCDGDNSGGDDDDDDDEDGGIDIDEDGVDQTRRR